MLGDSGHRGLKNTCCLYLVQNPVNFVLAFPKCHTHTKKTFFPVSLEKQFPLTMKRLWCWSLRLLALIWLHTFYCRCVSENKRTQAIKEHQSRTCFIIHNIHLPLQFRNLYHLPGKKKRKKRCKSGHQFQSFKWKATKSGQISKMKGVGKEFWFHSWHQF